MSAKRVLTKAKKVVSEVVVAAAKGAAAGALRGAAEAGTKVTGVAEGVEAPAGSKKRKKN